MRHDHTQRTRIERAQNRTRIGLRHADERDEVDGLGGADEVLQLLRIDEGVLGVQDDEVVPGAADHLHQRRRRDGAEQTVALAAPGEPGLDGVGTQHQSTSASGFGTVCSRSSVSGTRRRVVSFSTSMVGVNTSNSAKRSASSGKDCR